jgi:L-fucono-1,5-lactonase
MRIDAHQHFWKYDPVRDRWITDEMSVLKRDFLPEDLIPKLNSNQVHGSVAVQASHTEAETEFLLELAATHSEIRGVVGWIDLCAADAQRSLQRFATRAKFRGVRHVLQAEPDNFMLQDSFLQGISYLRDFALTYDVLVYARQLPAAVELVSRFPDQPFVIDHIAKPEIRSKRLQPWAEHIRIMAQNSNVYCKVSGLITEADWHNCSQEDIRPYLDVVFEAFGNERVMFGSDWPVCLLAGSYDRVIRLIEKYTEPFSEPDRIKIFGLNAARFYGL